MLSEISRVLTSEGVYIVISYGEEKKRQQLLENVYIYIYQIVNIILFLSQPEFEWNIKKIYKIYKPNVNTQEINFDYKDPDNYHYIYICKKVIIFYNHKFFNIWLFTIEIG